MDSGKKVVVLKSGVTALLVAGVLLAGSGTTLAAGKLGGASGMDLAGSARPELAGKLGGSGGADEFLVSGPEADADGAIARGGKIGVQGGGD